MKDWADVVTAMKKCPKRLLDHSQKGRFNGSGPILTTALLASSRARPVRRPIGKKWWPLAVCVARSLASRAAMPRPPEWDGLPLRAMATREARLANGLGGRRGGGGWGAGLWWVVKATRIRCHHRRLPRLEWFKDFRAWGRDRACHLCHLVAGASAAF